MTGLRHTLIFDVEVFAKDDDIKNFLNNKETSQKMMTLKTC